MTTKYSIDSEFWLRSNARLYERNGMLQMARNLTIAANDILRLRNEIERLRNELAAMKGVERE